MHPEEAKKLLIELIQECFQIQDDYSEADFDLRNVPTKAAWKFNECFDLKTDKPELHDKLKPLVVRHGEM